MEIVEKIARGRENVLIEAYILNGPSELKNALNLNEEAWSRVFDYLVFEHNLLFKTVANSVQFFMDQYIEGGTSAVREILDVLDSKYDSIFENVFDFLAISNDALYYHVMHNRDKYSLAMKTRGGDFVRKVLGIWKEKYSENWARILDLLLATVCNDLFTERTFDQGLSAFNKIVNGTRTHRPVIEPGIL
ncbi:hypothetical protein GF354_01230 [Candidatus Peregrinibacteria bacterium]|nr:hypothetical protein [Candidatus Peregrinibacteria bacterium]